MNISARSYFTSALLMLFLLVGRTTQAFQVTPQRAQTSLEMGADSREQSFFRPRFHFRFPVSLGTFLLDVEYLQRLNSRLQGDIDFWIKAGFLRELNSFSALEIDFNHFCRHKTSLAYPSVLNINEVLGRVWLQNPWLRLGLGGGAFVETSNHFDTLLTLSGDWPHILGSCFSAEGEAKWVDFDRIYYESTISLEVDPGLDIFWRLSRHYEFPETSYFGMRFKSRGKVEGLIDKSEVRGAVLSDDDASKVIAGNEFKLSFFRKPQQRLIVALDVDVPIRRDERFFHTFFPQEMSYMAALEFEKRLIDGVMVFGYGRLETIMPVDKADPFRSNLGIGLGIRNLTYFENLAKPLRFELFIGQNFSHDHDAALRIGINSRKRTVNLGSELHLYHTADIFLGQLKFFTQFGKEVEIRPFLAMERMEAGGYEPTTNFLFGLEFQKWK